MSQITNTEKSNEESFFLPDLCASQAVLMLVLVSELLSIVIVLASSSIAHFNWERFAVISFFVQWVAISSAALLCRLRPWLSRMEPRTAVLLSYLIIPCNTWIVSWVGQWVVASSPAALVSPFKEEILTHVAIASIVGGLIIRYFYLQAQLVARKQSELLHRIQALQSRIRPHFLFNSMNIIASLIATDPDTAEGVVEDLSELFRASLNDVGNQVPVNDEINLCKRYLRIEQLRLGDRLKVAWDVRSVPDDVCIPMLTLQPLLENAILHGIQPLPDGGVIDIAVSYQHGIFELKITNPIPTKQTTAEDRGNHMALENIKRRLSALYGDRAKLTSYTENNRYITGLSYPYDVTDKTTNTTINRTTKNKTKRSR